MFFGKIFKPLFEPLLVQMYKMCSWLTLVLKLPLCICAPDLNHAISHFPIGPKANGDRGSTDFLRLRSFFFPRS